MKAFRITYMRNSYTTQKIVLADTAENAKQMLFNLYGCEVPVFGIEECKRL